MKIGILMLVLGLILLGVGAALYIYANPVVETYNDVPFLLNSVRLVNAVGTGTVVIGGGLTLGGILRMILKK